MITFIVPAFNEASSIGPTIATIRAAVAQSKVEKFEVIIVDDGSSDGTADEIAALARDHPEIRSITNLTNLGLGASIRAGIDAATAPSFTVVPGDNDVSRGTLALLLNFRDAADVILTAPLNREQRSLGRNLLSMFFQMAYMITFQIYINYLHAPGIWPTAAARAARLQSRRFSIASELNVKVLRMGYTFAEVPGYFQAGPKARSIVTLRNLVEVIRSFIRLLYIVHVRDRAHYKFRPTRKQINFVRDLS